MPVLDQFNLSGKIAIITGGAGLLGVKHAEAIAEAGGIPILVDVSLDGLMSAKESLSAYEVETYVADITQKQAITELLAWTTTRFPQIDILINNAAINPKVEEAKGVEHSRLENFSIESYDKEIAVGLTGAFLCTQVLGTYMAQNGGGVILNIASDLGLIAPNQNLYRKDDTPEDLQPVKPVTYSIIKHALIGLTRYTATYWAEKGVRCNALAPGGVENGQNEVFLERIRPLIPMGRMAHKDEYKAAIVFMVSEASSYMNGAVLSIDGGRTTW